MYFYLSYRFYIGIFIFLINSFVSYKILISCDECDGRSKKVASMYHAHDISFDLDPCGIIHPMRKTCNGERSKRFVFPIIGDYYMIMVALPGSKLFSMFL